MTVTNLSVVSSSSLVLLVAQFIVQRFLFIESVKH